MTQLELIGILFACVIGGCIVLVVIVGLAVVSTSPKYFPQPIPPAGRSGTIDPRCPHCQKWKSDPIELDPRL